MADDTAAPLALRLGFVTGTTPDKWARAWRERRAEPLDLVPLDEVEQEEAVRSGQVDAVLARLPVDRTGLHCVELYEEQVVVVAGREHLVAAAEQEVETADLADEQLVRAHASGWRPEADQLAWPPMDERTAIETVAAGTGVVLVPQSVARLYARRDVVSRRVTDLAPTTVGLCWLVERDGEQLQALVGITRGRTARSSRG